MAEAYIDLAIRRQAILERLKSGEVQNFAREIRKIETLVRRAISELEGDFADLSRTKLNNLLRLLQQDQGEILAAATSNFLRRSGEIAAVYMAQELLDLSNTVDVRRTALSDFTNKDIFRRVSQRPLATDGDLLEPWIQKFSNNEIQRVNNAIRRGHSQGVTNQQMIQQIVGTRANNFQNGILQTTRRNAATVVRTSVQHVASAARQEVWEANQDVVSRYQFIATLDRVTSRICRTLDNQEFDFGKGPIPPVHPNCRSTTIPVLNEEFSFLSNGRTRSAEGGPVDADSSFYDWLNRQNRQAQIDVLGPTRAKLFRDGGLTAERFRELQFDRNFMPLTLDQMRAIEPDAFDRAGL